MGKHTQTIVINADIEASLTGMNKVVSDLNKGLREGITQIDLTKGIGSSLSKYIDKYKEEAGRFAQLTKGNKIEFDDVKEAMHSGMQAIKIFKELKRVAGDFNDLTILDAKKIFPSAFNSKVEDLQKKLEKISEQYSNLSIKNIEIKGIEDNLGRLRHDAELLQAKLNETTKIQIEATEAQNVLEAVNEEVERLQENMKQRIKIKWDTSNEEVSKAKEEREKKIREIENARAVRGVVEKDYSVQGKSIVYKGKNKKAIKADKNLSDDQKKNMIAAIEEYQKEHDQLTLIEKDLQALTEQAEKWKKAYTDIASKDFSKKYAKYTDTADESEEIRLTLEAQEQATKEAQIARERLNKTQVSSKGDQKALKETNDIIEKQTIKLAEARAEREKLKAKIGESDLTKAFQELNIDFSTDMLKEEKGINKLKEALQKVDDQNFTNLKKELLALNFSSEEVEEAVEAIKTALSQVDEGAKDITRTEQEIQALKKSILDFFSLTNSIQLFKRAVSSALSTIKELDATMTEAAVVTDFSVGDMWEKLPEYSTQAQKLGVSINSMYQATTLYYQQGLRTNEAMALGVETMKMGKIAAMDSTDATKAMTAALRGFNMELNETSAVRVNDVYSQLAAVTAADTAQIATAMEKTASIAASANMEFETTAALLAQIIETTQEAPETAGTAMKTIIARFSEVKNLKASGESKGKDEEGEDIDVNRIQTALKTVGISMDSFFAGTEGLHVILLKLAEKWDKLDFSTQRYIATTAAGSRQQSRFIAMMSDYARTTELVNEAQNSAGASQEQFDKTKDSMASKLQELKNAWDQFLMGLSNNEVLKFAIDTLTFIVEGINNIIDAISGGNGLIKSLNSLLGVIGALQLGKKVFDNKGGMGILGSLFNKEKQTEIIDEKITDKSGNIVERHIVKNPRQQGQQAGQKAGDGFVAGFEGTVSKTGRKKLFQVPLGLREPDEKEWDKITNSLKSNIRKNAPAIGVDADIFYSKIDKAGKNGDFKALAAAVDEYNAKAKEANGTLINLDDILAETRINLQQTSFNFQGVGQAAQGFGLALGLVANLLDSLGLEEGAELCSKLAGAFMMLGTALTAIPGAINLINVAAKKLEIQGWKTSMSFAWLAIIVVIAAAAVAAIYLVSKALDEASDTKQLEKLNDQMSDLSEAADEAKQKLEDLASAKEELDKMGKSFKNLVKGSQEWRKALVENNQKVLELINTHSQLTGYVSRGANGELTISQAGWDAVMEQQQEDYNNSIAAKTALAQQIQEKELYIKTENLMAEKRGKYSAQDKDYADFFATDAAKIGFAAGGGAAGAIAGAATAAAMGAAMGSVVPVVGTLIGLALGGLIGLGTAHWAATTTPEEAEMEQTGGLTYDQFNKFAALAAERGLSMSAQSSQDEFEAIFNELGYDEQADFGNVWNAMQELGASFDELSNSALAASIAERARVDAIASTIAQSSSIVQESEFGGMAEELGAQAFENYDDRVAEIAKTYASNLDVRDKNLDKGEAAKLIEQYAQVKGIDAAEVRRQILSEELTREQIANTLATKEVNEEFKRTLENTTKVLNRALVSGGSQYGKVKGLVTDRGLGLSLQDVSDMPKNYDDMADFLKSQGFTLSKDEAKSMGYESAEAFVNEMVSNATNASEAYKKIFDEKNALGMAQGFETPIKNLNDQLLQMGSISGLTLSQTQSLVNSLAEVAAVGGNAKELLNQFPDLLTGLTGADLDQAINLLTSTDWTVQDSIDSTIEALEAMGVELEDSVIEKFKNASWAIKSLNMERLEEKLDKLQALIDKVENKIATGSKVFTREEKDELIENGFGENLFVPIKINEYVYMGTTEELLSSIDNYTGQILGKMKDEIDDSVDKGEGYEKVFESNIKYQIVDSTTSKLLDGKAIIQGLASGSLGVGTTNNVEGEIFQQFSQHISRDTLLELIEETGVLDDVGEDIYTQYSDQALAEALIQGYQNYHGPDGNILEQNRDKQSDLYQDEAIINAAKMVGTQEFWDNYYIPTKPMNIQLLGWKDRVDDSFYKGKGYEKVSENNIKYYKGFFKKPYVKDTIEFDSEEFIKDLLTQEDFIEKNKDIQVASLKMRAIASNMGIENIPNMGFEELYEIIFNRITTGEKALDALITSEAGLDVVLEKTNAHLEQQGMNIKKNSALIKTSVYMKNQLDKKIDSLNKALKDQGEAFANAEDGIRAYNAALSQITSMAQGIFGNHIDFKFVETNRQLFLQLAQGGEAAAAAWEKLTKLSANKFLSGLELKGEELSEVYDYINKINNLNFGITGEADFSEIFAELANLVGGVDNAKALINSLGFEVNWVEMEPFKIKDKSGKFSQVTGDDETQLPRYKAIITKSNQTGSGLSNSGGGGGGGNSSYENPYDRFHDTLERINDTIRERERLERRYQRLLNQNLATSKELEKTSRKSIATRQEEIKRQEQIISGRIAQIQEEIQKNPSLRKYVQITTDKYGEQSIRINWNELEKLKDSDKGGRVDDFYSNLDGWLESIYEAQVAIEENQDAIYDELVDGKEQFTDLENQIKEAIVNERQKEIDELSAINESINETNANLIESIQSSVEKYRQDRDNQKTEEELADKQRRLAYLQQDTSGANALEILQLQEEIEQGQQDYTDTLIDQKISELQEQNDKAAEQRQQQIDIMQAQLDHYIESGEIWDEVHDLMKEGLSEDKGLLNGSQLAEILKKAENFDGLSKVQKMDWLNEINANIAQALKWLNVGSLGSIKKEGEQVTFVNKDGKTITGTVGKDGEVITKDGSIYTDVAMDVYGNYSSSQSEKDASKERDKREKEKNEKTDDQKEMEQYRLLYGKPSEITSVLQSGSKDNGKDNSVKALQHSLNMLGYEIGEVDGDFGSKTKEALIKFQKDMKIPETGKLDDKTKEAFKLKGYKTGGLVDFTGPAWLDGTKSHPEYILNSVQTEAFFNLVDVLGSLQSGNTKTAQNNGDNTYDIDINVESIGSDYDVEQLADTVKRLIVNDARYRNNNTINLMR